MRVKDTCSKSRIGGIGFARCVCAVIIVFFHYSSSFANPYSLFYKTKNATWGELAVSVFFLISGACLYANYPDLKTKASLKRFFFRRWKAIFPMFYVSYLFFYLLNVRHTGTFFYNQEASPLSLFLTVLGLDGYLLYRIPNYYIIGEWFLGAIILLYCLYPVILRIMKTRFLMPIILIVGYYLVLKTDIFIIMPFRNLICCMACFYTGMVLMKHRAAFFKNTKVFLISIILFLLLALIRIPADLVRFTLIIAQMQGILLFVSLVFTGEFLERFQFSRIINWVGMLSYPIFLLHHQIVLRMSGIFDPRSLWGVTGMAFACVLLSIACAYILSLINRLLTQNAVFAGMERKATGIKT